MSFLEADRILYPNFERQMISTSQGSVLALIGGNGPPLLMLHGDPQTHLCWHRIAPTLMEHYTIVLTDLRGRGETHKPAPSSGHIAYSKREMGREQCEVMSTLGFEQFRLVGHDRGARVARRIALDCPEKVQCLAVMDIVPELDFYELANSAIAQEYFYFFFLTQPCPQPEQLIKGAPASFMTRLLKGLSIREDLYHPLAFEAYLRSSCSDDAIAAMCECFRAGITVDIEHDRNDRARGNTINCPTLVIWGEQGVVGRHFDMHSIWQQWAPKVSFATLPCGHFIPEEAPHEVIDYLSDFLKLAE